MSHMFDRILDRMGKIIHRVNTPLVTGIVMGHMRNPVYDGIPHVDVGACHIDLGAENLLSVGIFSGLHVLEQLKVFFHRSVPIRAVLAGSIKRSAIRPYLIRGKIADECLAFFDELYGSLIHLIKIIGCKIQPVFPVCAKPSDVLFYGLHKLALFLCRVRIVKTQVELSAVFFCKAVVYKYGLGMSDMKIAVGLGRKTGVYLFISTLFQIPVDYIFDKVSRRRLVFALICSNVYILFAHNVFPVQCFINMI